MEIIHTGKQCFRLAHPLPWENLWLKFRIERLTNQNRNNVHSDQFFFSDSRSQIKGKNNYKRLIISLYQFVDVKCSHISFF